LVCFCGVVLFGAPFLPTLKPQIQAAFDVSQLKEGQTMLELGCGDGRVVLAAAKQGVKVIGYELNPILALVAWYRTRRYRKNAKIICGDFWKKTWPEADVIFVFLLDKYMEKLNKRCVQYPYKPVKLVSFAFKIKDLSPVAENHGVMLYEYK
jgi:16S rRNA A1518/A1519 N6-dimethyltransferase RsmA/KsgA/DIM1 with predicted DNA glycosylase/AP lyase activity